MRASSCDRLVEYGDIYGDWMIYLSRCDNIGGVPWTPMWNRQGKKQNSDKEKKQP